MRCFVIGLIVAIASILFVGDAQARGCRGNRGGCNKSEGRRVGKRCHRQRCEKTNCEKAKVGHHRRADAAFEDETTQFTSADDQKTILNRLTGNEPLPDDAQQISVENQEKIEQVKALYAAPVAQPALVQSTCGPNGCGVSNGGGRRLFRR